MKKLAFNITDGEEQRDDCSEIMNGDKSSFTATKQQFKSIIKSWKTDLNIEQMTKSYSKSPLKKIMGNESCVQLNFKRLKLYSCSYSRNKHLFYFGLHRLPSMTTIQRRILMNLYKAKECMWLWSAWLPGFQHVWLDFGLERSENEASQSN